MDASVEGGNASRSQPHGEKEGGEERQGVSNERTSLGQRRCYAVCGQIKLAVRYELINGELVFLIYSFTSEVASLFGDVITKIYKLRIDVHFND